MSYQQMRMEFWQSNHAGMDYIGFALHLMDIHGELVVTRKTNDLCLSVTRVRCLHTQVAGVNDICEL